MLETLRQEIETLPPNAQERLLKIVAELKQEYAPLSPQQLLAMPLSERHQYLQKFIPAMVEDFLHDPELTEFNALDTEDWELDND
jgi:hypothetical protein